jgi:hypothetical protein
MKRVQIEKYRGIEIEFDIDNSQFISVITDGFEKESKSHKAVRKFIDDYIKENNTFKSFFVHSRPGGYKSNVLHIVGIRKDGRFVYKGDDDRNYALSSYNEGDYVLSDKKNDKYLEELNQLNEEYDNYKLSYLGMRSKIIDKMEFVSLKEYKKSLE